MHVSYTTNVASLNITSVKFSYALAFCIYSQVTDVAQSLLLIYIIITKSYGNMVYLYRIDNFINSISLCIKLKYMCIPVKLTCHFNLTIAGFIATLLLSIQSSRLQNQCSTEHSICSPMYTYKPSHMTVY